PDNDGPLFVQVDDVPCPAPSELSASTSSGIADSSKCGLLGRERAMASDSLCPDVVSKLHDIEAVKFGEFKLKSGLISPVYFDLRLIFAACSDLKFDYVCGVPYTALPLPIATCISVDRGIPMLMRRQGDQGLRDQENSGGQYSTAASPASSLRTSVTSATAEILRREGLRVGPESASSLNREQGAAENLRRAGLPLRCWLRAAPHPAAAASSRRSKSVSASFCVTVTIPDQTTTTASDAPATAARELQLVGGQRPACQDAVRNSRRRGGHPSRRPAGCLASWPRRATNLCVAADRTLGRDVPGAGRAVATSSPDCGDLAKRHNFLIMEDAEAGRHRVTATGGQFRIAELGGPGHRARPCRGPGLLSGLEGAHGMAAVLVAEMSSEGSPINEEYSARRPGHGRGRTATPGGRPGWWPALVCQSDPGHRPPACCSSRRGRQLLRRRLWDGLGQRYREPGHVVGRGGCDVIIVWSWRGRGQRPQIGC
uniref:Reverse transcriptase domain-containing protein n=1 Tax=Macrostomum lignano TaxID=282301 RepID=A0A1I8FM72_9PLAT